MVWFCTLRHGNAERAHPSACLDNVADLAYDSDGNKKLACLANGIGIRSKINRRGKTMIKQISLAISLLVLLCLTACAPKDCMAEGCSDEIYKEDYCKYHYTKTELDKAGKELFDGIFGK